MHSNPGIGNTFSRADSMLEEPPELPSLNKNSLDAPGGGARTGKDRRESFRKQKSDNSTPGGGGLGLQTPHINVGGLGGQQQPYFQGMQEKTPQDIIDAMAFKIQQNSSKLRNLTDFFMAYDIYDQRYFEPWELQIIFLDSINLQEAQRLVNQYGQNFGMGQRALAFPQLLQMLQPKVQLNPGVIAKQSVFQSKFKTPQTVGHLNQILQAMNQRGFPMHQNYDSYFSSNYFTKDEFGIFLQKIGMNTIQSFEVSQLFQQFQILNENMISKICFIQALKTFQQSSTQPQNVGNNNQINQIQQQQQQLPPQSNQIGSGSFSHMASVDSLVTSTSLRTFDPYPPSPSESPIMQQFLQSVKSYMNTNHGLSFEGLLQRFNIPMIGVQHIEPSKFEEMCLRLSLMFTQQELQQLVSMMDTDHIFKVKISALRQKIESGMSNQPFAGIGGGAQYANLMQQQQLPQFGGGGNNNYQQPFQQNNGSGPGQMPQINLIPHLQNNNYQQPNLYGGQMKDQYQPQLNLNNLTPSFAPGNNFQNPQRYQQNGQPITFTQPQIGGGNFGLQHQQSIKADLDKIRDFLQQRNITNLRRLFCISFLQNKEVVELQEFLNFLQSPGLNITTQHAYRIAQECQSIMTNRMGYQTQQFIDLEKFEQELYTGNQAKFNQFQEQRNSYQILNRIYDSVRKYIMVNGGDIYKFFLEADLNKDNFISKAELKIALEKIGHYGLTDDEINQIYATFDQNHDGRISYQELCKQFSEFSNTKAIKDPTHWSFYIFENIRRACTMTQKPIADLFGFNNLAITNLNEKIPISKDQFFQSLARLNIPLSLEYEKKLLELLDADKHNQFSIDFVHFCELIGLHYQPIQYQKLVNDLYKNPLPLTVLDERRKIFRQLFDILQSRNITLRNLTIVFKGIDFRNEGIINSEEFIRIIQDIDFERKLDVAFFRQVTQKYLVQGNNINYQNFLDNLDFEFGKYKIIDYIFLTLKAAMEKLNLINLYDLFSKFDRSQGLRQFDKDMLNQTLKALGITLTQFELDMVLLEYDPQGTGQKMDFRQFEQDFKEFQQGKSQLNAFIQQRNSQYQDYNNFVKGGGANGGQQNLTQAMIKPPSGLVKEIFKKIARYLDSNPQFKFTQILLDNNVNATGILQIGNFKDILMRNLLLSGEETSHLVIHYDPNHRQQIKVSEFLNDIKDHILDVGLRIQITEIAQQLNYSNTSTTSQNGQLNSDVILSRYSKDFEEIQKAILIRNSNTYSWFQIFCFGSHQINRTKFREAIQSLNLQYLKPNDIDSIFDALDTSLKTIIDITVIDDAIRKYSSGSSVQMQDDIVERIVKAFNGDDNFLLKELMTLDKSGRGMLDLALFVDFFLKNAPQHLQFTRNDIQYLAQKYTNRTNLVDINIFLKDFEQVRKQKSIAAGYYQGIHNMSSSNFGQSFGQNNSQSGINNYNSGHRNMYLPQYSSTNTRTELARTQPPPGFRISIDPHYLEDLAKATYLREQMVQNFFESFAQQGGFLQETDFSKAVQILGMGWTVQTADQVFTSIDLAFNNYQRRMRITAEQIDQAVAFGAKKGINVRGEIMLLDQGMTRQISIDQMKDIILNRIRVPQIMPFDVIFLCKKYIQNLQNVVMYEKFLDDLEALTKKSTFYPGGVSSKNLAEYFKKALILQKSGLEDFLQNIMKMRDILTVNDLERGFQQLGLIPDITNSQGVLHLFNDIDINGSGKISLGQLSGFIQKMAQKETRDMQEDILEEIVNQARSKSVILDNIFNQDDGGRRGQVSLTTFSLIIQRNLVNIKEIDSKLLAQRYIDRNGNVNYQQFLQEYKTKERNQVKPLRGADNLLGTVGVKSALNTTTKQRLQQLLVKINDFVTQNRIQLTSIFSQYERGQSGGTIPQTFFFQSLEQLNLPIPNDDRYFISENYLVPNVQPPIVDYRQFLEDMKLHIAPPAKNINSLTKEQYDLYRKLGDYLNKQGKVAVFADSIIQRDITQKFYLQRLQIEDAFLKMGLKFIPKQFNTLFSALDTNHQGEFNYKQMFSLIFGEVEANKIFNGGILQGGGNRADAQLQQQSQFVMPQQPVGAASGLMAAIGKKLISSNMNYEEEFKKKIGIQQAQSVSPKITELEIIDVLATCRVYLGTDERTEMQGFFINKRDHANLIPLLDFLQALGLPAQTLGTRGQKNLPRKILNQNELNLAQNLIFKIRGELQRIGKKPQDIFEKWKQSQADVSLKVMQFKLALAELGPAGQQITDDQINLLSYYLAQEVPQEISYKKMYLAFTLTERDPPLQQEGADELKNYEKKVTMKTGVPFEIIDFAHFMREHGLSFPQIFKSTQKGQISRQEFETALKDAGYVPKDLQKFIEDLDVRGTRQFVSLDKLNEYLRKATSQGGVRITPQIARDRYQGFDPKVRHYLQKISEFLKRQNMTVQKMYEETDINKDGVVDKMEFVNKFSYLQIPGIQLSDLGMIFEALDMNNDGSLSINEFGMFIDGAIATRQQRSKDLDPKIIEDLKREILNLFQSFDENNDNFVTADEIVKAMMTIGQRITLEDAKNLIAQVDQNHDGRLDRNEFMELMLPKMKDELLSNEDSLEDLRALFLDADVDHSGTLSVDEIYSVIKKLGAEVTIEELVELMNEIDVDRDGTLDIDEFIALMSMGDELQFRSAGSKNTFINIKKSRKLHPVDFFKNFKNMPQNFVPSFITEQWVKFKKNLPSSVFAPQIDPTTMLYKDLFPVLQENISPLQNQRAFQPRLRPLPTELGCQILMEEAHGVPIPQSNQGFDRNSQIVKRMVRVGLYDTVKRDFILNSVQVNALYNQNDEDIWKFNAWKDNGTNPVLFKVSNKDDYVKPNIFMIFELVICVKIGEKPTEMSCGWCQLDLSLLDRQMTHKLPIKGGSPNAEMIIKDSDVRTNRTGFEYIKKVMTSKITSQLTVSIRPHTKFTDETKFHLEMLPRACFIQKRLLYFVSGFRNYLGEKLLKESSMNTFKHPEGDVVISCFPKILDNPDICEYIISIWSEDVWSTLNARQKMNVEFIMNKTKEYIQKLYPVIYAEEFKFKLSDYTMSAAGDQYLLRKREELIKAALCYGNPQAKFKSDKPLEAITTFKPFTVRELEFEVWDTRTAKQDRFFKQYEELGLLGGPGGSNQNSFIGAGQSNNMMIGNYQNPMMVPNDINNFNNNNMGMPNPMGDQNQFQQQPYQKGSLGAALNNAFR